MPRAKADAKKVAGTLKRFALDLPGTWEDMPWEGDPVAKVGKKIFLFMGHVDPERPGISVKLPDSKEQALGLECATPTGYGLGRGGVGEHRPRGRTTAHRRTCCATGSRRATARSRRRS